MPWRTQDRALFVPITGGVNDCGAEILSSPSPLGRIWFTLRPGHTNGSIDLVLDVENDPENRVLVLGSAQGGDCPYVSDVTLRVNAHGNVMMSSQPDIVPLGCGVNPPNSMRVDSGQPVLGGTVRVSIDNPQGTQPIGALPMLSLSSASAAAYPCGLPLSEFGMIGPGELLIDVSPAHLATPMFGPPWAGAGNRVRFDLTIPPDPSLVGLSVYVQGTFLSPWDATRRFGLTDGVQLRIAR
jgi:hypothetical protein